MRRVLAIIIASCTVIYGAVMHPFSLIAALALVVGGLVIIIHFEINGGQNWLADLWSRFKGRTGPKASSDRTLATIDYQALRVTAARWISDFAKISGLLGR